MVMKKKRFRFWICEELRYIIRKYIFFLVDSLFFFRTAGLPETVSWILIVIILEITGKHADSWLLNMGLAGDI